MRGYIIRGKLANMDLIYWSVCSSSRRGGDWLKGVDWGIVILASCKHHFIKVHENLEQHPISNISFLWE